MATLLRASQELFRRRPDECFSSLEAIMEHCREERRNSHDFWQPPRNLKPLAQGGELLFAAGHDGAFQPTDWSFSQLCRLSGVAKETVNRLSPETASAVFRETLPGSSKPVQLLTTGSGMRSIHGTAYTRLWNAELLECISECGADFSPPQTGVNGGTGLYCGEQGAADMSPHRPRVGGYLPCCYLSSSMNPVDIRHGATDAGSVGDFCRTRLSKTCFAS